ncbi:MAG: primase [Clostridia bacterium]|jgi:DNA primase|nr:primase [Clostridia bacterium]
MFFSEQLISEIIEKNDIVDVISGYMSLKKNGTNYKCLCPFHSEKSPSFSVSSTKQIFNCFGCGVGGNVISFVQKMERLEFVEALKFLADRAHIEVSDTNNEQQLKKLSLYNTLYKINQETARFFYSNLNKSKEPMDYLKGRGLNEQTIKSFGLGYSLNAWSSLQNHLRQKGFSQDMMQKAGLIAKSEKSSGYYDKFRNRIMFPIIDLKGNVIAFGGRVMDDSKPKYLNSPETPIFHKGENIYGLNFVKKQQNIENIIIVEGYMDVIALHQYGITNAVASLGTAFTENQAKLLKRFSNEIIIAYDADVAGQSATLKGLAILEKEGCTVKVLTVPSGKDPDEFVRKEGMEAFKSRIKNSVSLIEYKIEDVKKGLDIENIQDRIKFTKEFSMILKDIESSVEVDAYIKKYSNIMRVNETALYSELNRLKEKHKNGNNKHNIVNSKKEEQKPKNAELIAEIYLLNICMYDLNKAKNIFNIINPESFRNRLNKEIAYIIAEKLKEEKSLNAGEVISKLDDAEKQTKAAKILSYELPEKELDGLIQSSIDIMNKSKEERKIEELTSSMNELFQTGEKDKANEIFNEIKKLQRIRK